MSDQENRSEEERLEGNPGRSLIMDEVVPYQALYDTLYFRLQQEIQRGIRRETNNPRNIMPPDEIEGEELTGNEFRMLFDGPVTGPAQVASDAEEGESADAIRERLDDGVLAIRDMQERMAERAALLTGAASTSSGSDQVVVADGDGGVISSPMPENLLHTDRIAERTARMAIPTSTFRDVNIRALFRSSARGDYFTADNITVNIPGIEAPQSLTVSARRTETGMDVYINISIDMFFSMFSNEDPGSRYLNGAQQATNVMLQNDSTFLSLFANSLKFMEGLIVPVLDCSSWTPVGNVMEEASAAEVEAALVETVNDVLTPEAVVEEPAQIPESTEETIDFGTSWFTGGRRNLMTTPYHNRITNVVKPIFDAEFGAMNWEIKVAPGNNNIFMNLLIPESIMTDGGINHLVRDLMLRFYLKYNGTSNGDTVKGRRFTITEAELRGGYLHSHIYATMTRNSLGQFQEFCLGGSDTSQIIREWQTALNHRDEGILTLATMAVVARMKLISTHESTQGGPYIKIEEFIQANRARLVRTALGRGTRMILTTEQKEESVKAISAKIYERPEYYNAHFNIDMNNIVVIDSLFEEPDIKTACTWLHRNDDSRFVHQDTFSSENRRTPLNNELRVIENHGIDGGTPTLFHFKTRTIEFRVIADTRRDVEINGLIARRESGDGAETALVIDDYIIHELIRDRFRTGINRLFHNKIEQKRNDKIQNSLERAEPQRIGDAGEVHEITEKWEAYANRRFIIPTLTHVRISSGD